MIWGRDLPKSIENIMKIHDLGSGPSKIDRKHNENQCESGIALSERPTTLSGIALSERVACHECESTIALSERPADPLY